MIYQNYIKDFSTATLFTNTFLIANISNIWAQASPSTPEIGHYKQVLHVSQ